MLKASAILDTLVDGCEKGTFVLRLTRPDGTSRTWWMSRPDENALNDTAPELVLPEAAELGELLPALLAPKKLPGLWPTDEITAKAVGTCGSWWRERAWGSSRAPQSGTGREGR